MKTEPSSSSTTTTSQPAEERVDPVIKCNDCGKFIKQSIFKDHKLEHVKNNSTEQGSKAVANDAGKATNTGRRRDEKQVDYVDLGHVSDDDEITDVTKKKVLEKTLPCPSCDVMFATTMSLKMHMNLSHPVKTEATETEQLLKEREDIDDNEKVQKEMNSLGTSEMLDDLVSFLNEI